jgi:hypothetical protein
MKTVNSVKHIVRGRNVNNKEIIDLKVCGFGGCGSERRGLLLCEAV